MPQHHPSRRSALLHLTALATVAATSGASWAGQGSSTINPRPWQSWHGSLTAKTPPEVEVSMPLPWQVGHTRGSVPDLAPAGNFRAKSEIAGAM